MKRAFCRLACVAVVLFFTCVAAAPAARPLALGFFDGAFFESDAPTWLDRSVQAGSDVIRLSPGWVDIAPASRPAGFDPANPGDPAYKWGSLDTAVRQANARGLQVLFTIYGAPDWAEAPGRPSNVIAATWRPDPKQLGLFARAVARRYSGTFPDPQNPGQPLPRIRLWQVWNEPNLSTYLTPQWTRHGGSYSATSPGLYRAMLNAAYNGIKSVHSDNLVGTAGTAPYGDFGEGGLRIPPVAFLRDMLCLNARLRPLKCKDPAHFDALAHHPYGIRGPNQHAFNADDAAVPDLGKLTRVVNAARRSGRALPRSPKHLWVTEISWDGNPPDPQGVPEQRRARWLEESFYVLWRQGVDLITWFQIRDQPPVPSYAASNQSGVYSNDGRPKLALTAFQFPFVVEHSGRHALAWGRAPASGQIVIQRSSGHGWATITKVNAPRGAVFTRQLRSARAGTYRAVQGGQTSLTWTFG